jgi:hypothetical protein
MSPSLVCHASREAAAPCLGATPPASSNVETYQIGSLGKEARHSPELGGTNVLILATDDCAGRRSVEDDALATLSPILAP